MHWCSVFAIKSTLHKVFFLKAVCKMKYRTIYQARVLEIPPCLYQAFIIC